MQGRRRWSVRLIQPLHHETRLAHLAYGVVGAFFRDNSTHYRQPQLELRGQLISLVEDILMAPFSFVRRKADTTKSLAWRRFFEFVRRLSRHQQPLAKLGDTQFNVVNPPPSQSLDCWYGLVSLAMSSSKFMALEKLLLQCKERNERALVFAGSPYTLMFAVYYLRLKDSVKFGHTSTLAKRQRGEPRGAAVFETFRDPGSPYTALLMGLQRTSVGLNLMAANHVIFLDVQVDKSSILQAVGRIRRIGQTREQHVTFLSYDLALDRLELGHLLHSQAFPDDGNVPDVVRTQTQTQTQLAASASYDRDAMSLMSLNTLKSAALCEAAEGSGPVDITPPEFNPDMLGE